MCLHTHLYSCVTAGIEHTAEVTANAKEFTNIQVNNKKSTKYIYIKV